MRGRKLEAERIFVAYVLAVVLTGAVFSVYEFPDGVMLTWLKCMGYLLAPFCHCFFAERHRIAGGILIGINLVAIWRMLVGYLWSGWRTYGVGFQEWALTAGSEVEDATIYVRSLWLGAVFFFGFTVYYFAKVLYRTSFLMLISLLPCVLYAKVFADIENGYVVLIASLNVCLLILYRQSGSGRNEKKFGLKTTFAAALFTALLFLVVSLIPKQEEAKYYDVFEDLFLGGDTRTELGADFSEIGSVSGDAGRYSELGNRRLYRIRGDGIGYLKRQNFDYYDFRQDRWTYDADFSEQSLTFDEWRDLHGNCNLKLFGEALKQVEELSPGLIERYGLSVLAQDNLTDPTHRIQVESLNFSAAYYVAPGRTVKVVPEDGESVVATPSGCFRRESGTHPSNFTYEVTFYDQFTTRQHLLELGAGEITMENWGKLLWELAELLPEEGVSYQDTVWQYLDQYCHSLDYRSACAENTALVSKQIVELAKEVVKDCNSDYEKAAALEQFFQSSDFTYDLRYRARDASPEYFLFTSKRGTCSDYASAYVLMARAVGLTVRYAEGYVPERASYEGVYYVKDSTSHAYPEVYLPLLGWTVFEPTSANVELYDDEQEGGFFGLLKNLKVDFGLAGTVVVFFLVLICGIVVIRVIWPMLEEMGFRILLHLWKPKTAVTKMYGRVVTVCKRRVNKRADTLTPRELATLLLEYKLDIRKLSETTEALAYAEKGISKEKKMMAQAEYESFIRKKHRLRKK